MSLYKRGGVWWSRIEWRGEPLQRSTKCTNKNDARQIESVWKADLAKGEVGIFKSPTVSDFTERFINYLSGRVAKRTWRFYIDAWTPIENHMGKLKLSQIDGPQIEKFINARLGEAYSRGEKGAVRTVSKTTVNHSLRCLRRATRLAAEWKLIPRAPRISLLKGEREREYVVSENELARMIALCDTDELGQTVPFKARRFHKEMRDVLPFLLDTGLRAGELCRLDWADVDLQRGTVYIRNGKTKNAQRRVPLTSRAKAVLNDLGHSAVTPAVFHRNGQRVTVTWMSHQFTALARRLKMPGAVLHSLRHSACSTWGKAGLSAWEIMRLAGHGSVVISQRYVHSDEDTLQRAIEKVNRYSLQQ